MAVSSPTGITLPASIIKTFAMAHTFCASQDGMRNSAFSVVVLTNTTIFLHGSELRVKSRSLQRLLESKKKKVGVTTHLRKMPMIHCFAF